MGGVKCFKLRNQTISDLSKLMRQRDPNSLMYITEYEKVTFTLKNAINPQPRAVHFRVSELSL